MSAPEKYSRWFLISSMVVAGLGCSSPVTDSVVDAVSARGSLLKAGVPLQVEGREIGTGMVSLTFIPISAIPGTEQTFATTVDEQGNFDLPGGMPAGEYRAAVRQWEPYPTTDKLGGKYDEQNTPLKVTIDGTNPLQIVLE